MIGPHYSLTATLEVVSPLHIGTGEVRKFERFDGDNKPPEVSVAALDSDGKPYLPGASIKGVLRSLSGAHRENLFGPDRVDDAIEAKSGHVIVWNARFAQTPAEFEQAPYAAKRFCGEADSFANRGLFIDARTAIEPEAGVADDKKLFHQLLVMPKTRFHFSLTLHHRETSDMRNLAAALTRLLCQMASDEGITLGRGTRTGQGRVKLDPTTVEVKTVPSRFDAGAEIKCLLEGVAAQTMEHGRIVERRALHLKCDGPYLVSDSSKVRKQTTMDEQSKEPHLQALVEPDGKSPRLPGSSIMGALRARALWLAALPDRDIQDENSDNEDDRDDVLRPLEDPARLSPVQRLFGVAGWRGLVSIDAVRFVGDAQSLNEAAKKITSVRLDRFSGAPIDGGLFTTQAWLAPSFEISLSLRDRVYQRDGREFQALRQHDKDLFRRLIRDLESEGLMLGHGTNKGYGWFAVTAEGGEAS